MQLSFWFFAVRRFTLYGFQTLQAFVSLGALLAFNQAVHATLGLPGTLDSSWSTSSPSGAGKVVTPVGLMDDVAAAVLVQPDGKIVVTGSCYNNRYTSHSADFCASRYNADGTLDATFNASGGTPGTVITAFGANDSYAKAAALQPDGKIVLGGYCHNGVPALCALRYNANGTLDTSFNVAGSQPGTLTPDFQSYYTYAYGFAASAVLLQANGKIVLAGYCSHDGNYRYTFCAARFNTDGTLDTTFNSARNSLGFVIVDFGGILPVYGATAVQQADGKIVLAGNCNDQWCATRVNADGTLDLTFSSGGSAPPGLVTTAIGATSSSSVNAALWQADGHIVLVGICYDSTTMFCSARYNLNGTLDTTFGASGSTPGTVVTAIGGDSISASVATAAALQSDGKFILSGFCRKNQIGDRRRFCASRYNANGALDETFNASGVQPGTVITTVGPEGEFVTNNVGGGVAVQPDGKLVLAGACDVYVSASNSVSADFCVVRYDGGKFAEDYTPDLDGDGRIAGTVDGLINLRLMLGLTGEAAVAGIAFPTGAVRTSWPQIQAYMTSRCGGNVCAPDFDGDGQLSAVTDGLIHLRLMLGFAGDVVVSGITFPASATRKTWPLIRDYLGSRYGVAFAP